MQCPDCNSEDVRRNGHTVSGVQQYKCKTCGRSFTGNSEGRPPVFDRPLTKAEIMRRYRQKKRQQKKSGEGVDA